MQLHAHIEHAKKCINSKWDYNAFTNTFFITVFNSWKKISILNLTQETALLSAHKIPNLRKLIKSKKYLTHHLNFLWKSKHESLFITKILL